jgi:PAS domain S-box-containing protein
MALLATAGRAAQAADATAADAENRVTLQLKWFHQFQFAGYYAAQAKGFYREEGLDVVIREGGPDRPPLPSVLSGSAQYSIGDSDLLVARIKGQPIVALAAIFQHSPYVLLSRKDRNIRAPSDLAGKTVMMSDDQGGIQLRTMLRREGVDARLVHIVPQSWRLDDLVYNKVDAVSAYATVEPAKLRDQGVEISVMRSLDYGVDFYGDILFTSESEATQHPARTAAFVRATQKGWEYAMSHEAEMADLILTLDGVSKRGVTRSELLGEAQTMRPFVLADVVEVGHMNPGRFENMARTLFELGLVPPDYSLSGWMFEPDSPVNARRWRLAAGAALAGCLLAALVTLWNLQMRRNVQLRTRQLQDEISHRTQVEHQLKLSQEMQELIFGTAATGIVMNTPDGRFITANPAYRAILGYTDDELRGIDTRDLTHPDDRPEYMAMRERMLSGEISHFTHEKRYLCAGGEVVWVSSTVSLVRDATGTPTHVVSVIEDITQRRATEEKLRDSQASILRLNAGLEERVRRRTAELEASNKELEAFSYSVSHDLRSPLNTIDGFSTLLQKLDVDGALGDKGRHYLARIRAGTHQMAELIEGLLSLAKFARDPLRMSAVDVSAIAGRIAHELHERDASRQVQVHVQPGMMAWGDSLLLQVVLQNLLGNAWKFTAKVPQARIDFGQDIAPDGETVFFVRDNGAGFDMAHAARLFRTFERLHRPAEFPGTGIGLAIVHRIIKRHRGRVWAESALGEGATFYFTLGGQARAVRRPDLPPIV